MGVAEQTDQDKIPLAMIQTMRKLKSGYINGTRVMLGSLKDFLNTSAITDLSFLGSTEDGYPDRLHPDVQTYLDEHLLRSFSNRSTMNLRGGQLRPRSLRRRMSCKGAIKKTRSINVDCKWETADLYKTYIQSCVLLLQLTIWAWRVHRR